MHRLEPKYRKNYTEFSPFLNQHRKCGNNDSKIAEIKGIERSMITNLGTRLHLKAGYDEGNTILKLRHSVANCTAPKLKSLEQLQSEHLAELNADTK